MCQWVSAFKNLVLPFLSQMDSTSPSRSRGKEKSKEDELPISSATSSDTPEPKRPKERSRSKSPRSKRSAVDSATSASSSAAIQCDWDALPYDACLKIMEHFADDIPALISLGSVSSFWRQVSTSETLWRKLFFHRFSRLEPTDAHFLEHSVPQPGLLQQSSAQGKATSAGPSSYWHLFAAKWAQHKHWRTGNEHVQMVKPSTDIERFSMMVPWRGFCVTAGSDGRICFWDPNKFHYDSGAKPSKKKSTKVIPEIWRELRGLHEYHIWWMLIEGDLCFTVGSDGTFKVTDLSPLVNDPMAELETITVIWNSVPYWAIDVSPEECQAVIGSQSGVLTVFEWEKDDWRKWKALRTVKLGSGVWDVCLLPGRRFAACGFKNISVYDFKSESGERRQDDREPTVASHGALLGEPKRQERFTPPNMSIPHLPSLHPTSPATSSSSSVPYVAPQRRDEEAALLAPSSSASSSSAPSASASAPSSSNTDTTAAEPPKERVHMVRNLKVSSGLLIAAVVNKGIDAFDVNTGDLVWSIPLKGEDIFDLQQVNNRLVGVGTDEFGFAVVIVWDIVSRKVIARAAGSQSIGRVFSACVTDDAIYVCGVDAMLHITFPENAKNSKKESNSSGCVVS